MFPIYPPDFPFTIMDVAALLRLNIRRGGAGQVYADCPLCGDRRGRLSISPEKNVWHCHHCGESGGILALYAKTSGVTNAMALQEIREALLNDGFAPEPDKPIAPPEPQVGRASPEAVHLTYSALLQMLTLTPAHREHLRTVRGLTEEQIEAFCFKSTPPQKECRSLTERLLRQGCTVEGVPGFHVDGYDRWTVKFFDRTSGILIPIRGIDRLICGLQLRLDTPIRDESDPPEKKGIKYLPLSSAGKKKGTGSGSPVHFAGDPGAGTVYVTEGALKADICHALTGHAFAATMGVSSTAPLAGLFAVLKRNGTREIVEADDMDKFTNDAVHCGAEKVRRMATEYGFSCRQLTWDPRYKGMDDWLLARLREHKDCEETEMNELNTVSRRFRIYQAENCALPFAFHGMEVLQRAGYEQPPASEYRLVYDGVIDCPEGAEEIAVLERIYTRFNISHPRDYRGRSVSVSDVIELRATMAAAISTVTA